MFEMLSTPVIVGLFVVWFWFLLLSNKGQPKGLWTLALANTGERFGYYTMLSVFVLFLGDNFHFDANWASETFSTFLSVVYLLPLFGGMLADKFGYSKMVVTGIFVMFVGYLVLSVPLGGSSPALVAMCAGLLFVSLGTGLFKGNLQVMVGELYNTPEFQNKRDSGFSLFYMAINLGALFAPTAAIAVMDWAQGSLGFSKADSYHFAFAVACVSVIASILIYYTGKSTFAHVTGGKKKAVAERKQAPVQEEKDTKERIVCLCLVFAVVVFFWMAFHQNGLTLTWFADEYTATSSTGIESMMFDVRNLLACIFVVYALLGIFQNKGLARALAGVMLVAAVFFLYNMVPSDGSVTAVNAPIFQQFNACFVVMLTPVSIALFTWLGNKGKEPKAPVKIGLGMLVAAAAYLIVGYGHESEYTTFGPLTSSYYTGTPLQYCTYYFKADGACIPQSTKYVREVARLIDIMYSDLGTQLIAYGVEGSDWTWDDDAHTSWTFHVPSDWDGNQEQYRATITPNVGSASALYWSNAFVGKMNDEIITNLNRMSERYRPYLKVAEPTEIRLNSTEYDQITTIKASLDPQLKYLEACFIRGEKDPYNDSDWASFISTLDGIGAKQLLQCYNDAYARYKSN